MKILMLLEGTFPGDERVEKEIQSLMGDGHEIRIATYSFRSCSFRDGSYTCVIYRKKIGRIMYKLGAAILVLPFYFRFWERFVQRIRSDWEFEALHVHDLPLARLGYRFKKKWGVRFVADQHEFYSNWIIETAHYNTLSGTIIKRLSNWEAYERKYLALADLVVTVEEPLKKIYLEQRGIDPDKIIHIPNTPLKSNYSVKPRALKNDMFNLLYCGGMDHLRGLDMVISSLALLRGRIPEIRLVLVGKIGKHFDPVRYAESEGVADLLMMRQWVDHRELPHEIDQGDIGIFTPPTNREEIHNTIATKIYQYMARGKPVIVGSARYMKAFVEKNEIGLAVDETSPESFAGAVIRIYSDRELALRFSANALKLIEQYFWERTVTPLLECYKKWE